jgi:hypothetical protein
LDFVRAPDLEIEWTRAAGQEPSAFEDMVVSALLRIRGKEPLDNTNAKGREGGAPPPKRGTVGRRGTPIREGVGHALQPSWLRRRPRVSRDIVGIIGGAPQVHDTI